MKFFTFLAVLAIALGHYMPCSAQNSKTNKAITRLQTAVKEQSHEFDVLDKKLEDLLWFDKTGDVAYISKVRIAGPPVHNPKKTGHKFGDQFRENDVIFYAYVFIPRTTKANKQYPLIVFPHGGIHGTLTTVYAPFIRELMAQGYIVVAPDYRGSIGYGRGFYRKIDYGGRENEDALMSAKYMIDNYSIVDPDRVGIMGWSHGGMITLMNVTQYPDVYKCGYAGVPVSDVAYRLEYQGAGYAKNFSADYHVGKLPSEDPKEYARRSPVSYASKLSVPLMITTTKNDDDVSWTEVKRMIDSLTYYKKDFVYKIYEPMPGAHVFERIDTREATEIRYQAHKFMEQYLHPPKPFKSYNAMRKAGYYFD
jgi:dipeptidyl aminopeptidase/acylaminoacyl peptidase